MKDVSRRTFLYWGGAIPITALLASCVEPSPPPQPAPSPTPSQLPTGFVPFEQVPSFGPNGTHYPAELPWIGGTAATEVESECEWDAIELAVQSLTPEQVAAGAVVRVAPGELIGRGDGSSRNPVLASVGDPNWTRNVLICPRDGYGSVTVVQAGFRMDDCHHLSLFGFSGPEVGIVLTKCTDIQLGWGQWSALGITRGGARIALYELVLGFRRNPEDTFGVRPTDQNEMIDISRYGCAFGPSVKPADSKAHCDTAQLEGTGTGTFGPFTSVDCVDYGSSNAALLLHAQVTRAEFHHSMILGERLPWQVYPLAASDYQGEPNAFAGGAMDVRLYDSIVCGAIGRLGYTHVVNSVLSYPPQARQLPKVEGAWTVDPSVRRWTAADIYELTGTDYSAKSLAGFWKW